MNNEKVVVLTGASGALGHSLSTKLNNQGFKVIGLVRSAEKIRNPECFRAIIETDLGQSDSVIEAYKSIFETENRIFGLINNAAVGTTSLALTQNTEEIDRVIQVNLKTPILLSKLLSRRMLENREGRIVMISSIASLQAYKGLAVYSASKAGLEAFSRVLAREVGVRGVTVNSVLPGFMETPMTEGISQDQLAKVMRRAALQGSLRLDSVSDTVLFLLSQGASQITGQSIRVDMGASL